MRPCHSRSVTGSRNLCQNPKRLAKDTEVDQCVEAATEGQHQMPQEEMTAAATRAGSPHEFLYRAALEPGEPLVRLVGHVVLAAKGQWTAL